jgi:hypothetical protein
LEEKGRKRKGESERVELVVVNLFLSRFDRVLKPEFPLLSDRGIITAVAGGAESVAAD